MRYLILAVLFSLPAFADVIITADGRYIESKPGQKAVFVPIDTPDTVIAVQIIPVTTPKTVEKAPISGCTPKDGLGLGGEPCPE